MSPAPGTVLHPGKTVSFSATLDYTLASATSGRIGMVVQNQVGTSLQPVGTHQPLIPVAQGTAKVALAVDIPLPASGVSLVKVFFPLYSGVATSTTTVALVSYPVM